MLRCFEEVRNICALNIAEAVINRRVRELAAQLTMEFQVLNYFSMKYVYLFLIGLEMLSLLQCPHLIPLAAEFWLNICALERSI